MKVQLVVVRGKPEGKVIPLVGPNFKIGRGETCHLRPNSEQVSREHAEFTISGDNSGGFEIASPRSDACRLAINNAAGTPLPITSPIASASLP